VPSPGRERCGRQPTLELSPSVTTTGVFRQVEASRPETTLARWVWKGTGLSFGVRIGMRRRTKRARRKQTRTPFKRKRVTHPSSGGFTSPRQGGRSLSTASEQGCRRLSGGNKSAAASAAALSPILTSILATIHGSGIRKLGSFWVLIGLASQRNLRTSGSPCPMKGHSRNMGDTKQGPGVHPACCTGRSALQHRLWGLVLRDGNVTASLQRCAC
jgi:hypothetical protein